MAQTGPEASRLQQIWKGWRKEIIRGVVLFVVVIGVGLAVTRMFGVIPLRFGERSSFNLGDFNLDNRDWIESFRWTGKIAPDHTVWIRNLNGPISVEAAEGDSVVVTAEKSSRHSHLDRVEIVSIPNDGSLTICALWDAEQQTCASNGHYTMKNVRRSDVAVRFFVQLPTGVKVDLSTVNGGLEVQGATAPVVLETVNGRIEAATSQGPISAKTVNGSIDVVMTALLGGDVDLKTVNGSITAGLPSNLNAELDAETMTGRVNTDFPLQVVGRISQRHVQAQIGTGGRRLNFRTVNGSINIHEAASDDVEVPVAQTPRPPRAARPARAAVAPKPATAVQPR